jgi:uncharacterized surface protein with fasciclin (FAS1) repeats
MQSFISKYTPLSLLLFCSLLLTSCLDSSTNSGQQRQNLLETAKSVTQGQDRDEVLTTFVGLLEDADLDSTVANEGPQTVIAPTNDAFDNLSIDITTLDSTQVTEILNYHRIEEPVNFSQISGEENFQSDQGGDLFFEVTQDSVFINDSNYLGGVSATNGPLYIVNKVLLPDAYLDVYGLIAKRSSLNALESAIDEVNLGSDLEDESASYTVFAPSDEALENDELSGNAIQYHVLNEKVFSNNISGTYTTLSGDEVTIDVSGSTVTYNDEEVTFTEENIEGTNGVVHIIDTALPPPSSE